MSAPPLTVHSSREPAWSAWLDPLRMVKNLASQRTLIGQLAAREIRERYRSDGLGLFWAVASPLMLLSVYTFVFGLVFRARWSDHGESSRGEFALALFAGMVLYQLFADVVTRAPDLIVSRPNYVTKIVFPLEILVVAQLLASLFATAIGYAVWGIGWLAVEGTLPHLSVLWLPLVVLPVALTTAGAAWIVASLGVFVRDIGHAVTLGVQVLFFLTPIFYSVEAVPPPIRTLLFLNPLTYAVCDAREVLMWGGSPDWPVWFATWVASGVFALFGYAVFMKSKRAFADVV